jgi:hypothetical protein
MATSQQFLVCDSSTLANFKSWAQAISAFFATATWTQSSDTGQVNWSTIGSVPGSSAFVYEVWQPNDGLTTFYVKVEYGNVSGTNCPSLRLTIGTGTNGAGTLTGFVSAVQNTNATTFTIPSAVTTYECDFSGAAGRIGALMWRNGINNCQQIFAIERSLNSSGAYTSSHVTIIVGGIGINGSANTPAVVQQTVILTGTPSVGPTTSRGAGFNANQTLAVRSLLWQGVASSALNGSIPFDTVAPVIGFFDYPLTIIGVALGVDIVEGVTFGVTIYGSTRTYMPTKNGHLFNCLGDQVGTGALCMRYD